MAPCSPRINNLIGKALEFTPRYLESWGMDLGRLDRRSALRILGQALTGSVLALQSGTALAALAPQKPMPSSKIIVLDPGHGGIDPGTIGHTGVYEKDITLETAREIARLFEATKHYKVVLTRSDDEFVELGDRVERARDAHGDLFVSIHADAIPNAAVRGASVFTLSEKASDAEAAELAARENKSDLIAGIDLSTKAPEVSNILLDLERRQTNNLSIGLARRLVAELGRDVRLLNNSHRSAGFAVLKAPDIPSALVEIGCLSNRDEERELQAGSYQRRIAASIVRSVNDYFDQVARL